MSGFKKVSLSFILLLVSAPLLRAEVMIIDEAGKKSGSAVETAVKASAEADDQNDNKATLVSVEGRVRVMRKGTDSWLDAQAGMVLTAGDKILTDAAGSAEVSYDDTLLNLVHIKENTMAEFRTIEPTDLYLEDGTVFSALDGLDPQSDYQVSTATAVAAVRGTHFDVQFDKKTQAFSAAALQPDSEGQESKIFLRDPSGKTMAETLEIVQGQQFDLPKGAPLQRQFIRPAAPERSEAGRQMRSQMFDHVKARVPEMGQRREAGRHRVEEKKARINQEGPGGAKKNNGAVGQLPLQNRGSDSAADPNRVPRPDGVNEHKMNPDGTQRNPAVNDLANRPGSQGAQGVRDGNKQPLNSQNNNFRDPNASRLAGDANSNSQVNESNRKSSVPGPVPQGQGPERQGMGNRQEPVLRSAPFRDNRPGNNSGAMNQQGNPSQQRPAQFLGGAKREDRPIRNPQPQRAPAQPQKKRQ